MILSHIPKALSGPGGGGGEGVARTLIFSYISTLARTIMAVQKFEFKYFAGFSEIFFFLGGYDKIVDIWGGGGASQNWTIWGG